MRRSPTLYYFSLRTPHSALLCKPYGKSLSVLRIGLQAACLIRACKHGVSSQIFTGFSTCTL